MQQVANVAIRDSRLSRLRGAPSRLTPSRRRRDNADASLRMGLRLTPPHRAPIAPRAAASYPFRYRTVAPHACNCSPCLPLSLQRFISGSFSSRGATLAGVSESNQVWVPEPERGGTVPGTAYGKIWVCLGCVQGQLRGFSR